MRSSAGSPSPDRRAPLWLAGLACAALALAFALALFATIPRPDDAVAARSAATVEGRFVAPAARASGAPASAPVAPQPVEVPENPFWALLQQWTLDAGSLAVLGLAIVLVVRSVRRRGALR